MKNQRKEILEMENETDLLSHPKKSHEISDFSHKYHGKSLLQIEHVDSVYGLNEYIEIIQFPDGLYVTLGDKIYGPTQHMLKIIEFLGKKLLVEIDKNFENMKNCESILKKWRK